MQKSITRGFILLPVVMAISLIAGLAFLMNRDGAENVNRLAGEIEATKAEFAAKAAVNQQLWQANNSNCTGFSNISNASFSGYTVNSTINPGSNSPVTISATASDSNGASYTLKRDFLKTYQPLVTKTLPLDNANGKDASISSSSTTSNYGVSDDTVSSNWLFIWFYKQQLIQFDLSALPANAHIVSAQLQLYQKSGMGKNLINIYRVSQDWLEGSQSGSGTADGATWKTYDGTNNWLKAGGDYNNTLMASALVDGAVTGIQSWEIAPLVQGWLNGSYANKGMLLKAMATTTSQLAVTFAGREDSIPSYRPTLVVNYNCECGLTCVGATCKAGTVSDDFNVGTYSGSTGSLPWTGNWLESGESDGPTTGKLSILSAPQCANGTCLDIRKDTAAVISLTRELNLSNAVTATLSYSYKRVGMSGPIGGGAISLQVSKDGGTTFSTMKSYPLDTTDLTNIAESVDISAYAAAKTQVRFISSGASYPSYAYIDNLNITVSCTPRSLKTNTITLTPAIDTYLDQANTSTNYGSVSPISVGTNSSNKNRKSLLQFDVSSIPSTATVTGARLRLFSTAFSGTGSMSIGAYKIIASWSETTATWSNFSSASYYKSTQLAVTSAPLASGTVNEWTLPVSLINEWRDAVPTPNYGLALVYEGGSNNTRLDLASSESPSTALVPQLIIDYSLP